jgi:uncharacterized protein YbaR (Trm112 family)
MRYVCPTCKSRLVLVVQEFWQYNIDPNTGHPIGRGKNIGGASDESWLRCQKCMKTYESSELPQD